MRKLIRSALLTMLVVCGLSATAMAQPGGGRQLSETGSTTQLLFEGLTDAPGGATSGKRWIKPQGGQWQEDGTWEKDGDDVKTVHAGTLIFTHKDAANFNKQSGNIVNHIGGQSAPSWYVPQP